MNEQLRKRLEEAAEKYQEEYETTERVAFTHGAIWGYKEAITFAKEWLKELIENNRYEYLDDDMIVYFEAYMNNLWKKVMEQ